MTRRKWVLGFFVGIVACAVFTLLVFYNDVAIGYHRSMMMRSWAKIHEVGPGGNQMPWADSYEHHRDALVQYGYLARREFPLVVKPPETNRVWKKLKAEFPELTAESPGCLDVEMHTTQWGSTENKITVWDRPERIPAWEAAIRKYDVPEAPTSTEASAPSRD